MRENLFIKERGQGLPLVFLHGWGFNHLIWDSITDSLCKNWHTYQVDLPGHGNSSYCEYKLPLLTPRFAEYLPQNAIWIGWSLGGLLALAMATRYPIRALVLVSSSPCFTTSNNRPYAMDLAVLQEFAQQLETDTVGTLQRFLVLQVKNSEFIQHQLQVLHTLRSKMPMPPLATLRTSLQFLITTDLRHELKSISCPSLLILGERDLIVPVEIGKEYLHNGLNIRVHSIPKASHIPFLSHPKLFLQQLQTFLHEVIS
jgi:pimeloyl-[acyl-carrier protein] methyl ester esterase